MQPDTFPSTSSAHAWCGATSAGDQILALRVGERGLRLGHASGAPSCHLPAGWSGLLAFRSGLWVQDGDAQSARIPVVNPVKLQVFMDRAFAVADTPGGAAIVAVATLWVPGEHLECTSGLERWYVGQCLRGDAEYQRFASWLRQSERYQVVSFLLQEGASGSKLGELASRYGVSISHFRRLCHQALGCAAKPELRDWRTAQALLAIAPGETLTDIALTFGFASSSHFSKEIRDLLGVSPSSLTDITRLSSK